MSPFFWNVRFDARAAEIAASVEESKRGNLPVSPFPFHETAHAVSFIFLAAHCTDLTMFW